ncbi:peptidoglycan-binding domain-containing protein [Dongia deserti]|uniref:peptidoglycan-binding domain-containing protein n=1 Tax=Dongia deserti TaxID=2268030 RepID=UPI000E65D83E|nr:peptidoglycan-binding domain-containing protein [Dongia deserti]
MNTDPLDADLHEPPRSPADSQNNAQPGWMGLIGGTIVLGLAIAIAVGIWHLAGNRGSRLTVVELSEAETLLDQLGFPPGPIDGVIDEESRNAIRDFQITAGIAVDGELDLALLGELRAAKAELSGN